MAILHLSIELSLCLGSMVTQLWSYEFLFITYLEAER